MMDCDTTGVEPDLALVKYKKLVGGGTIKIVNQTVPHALTRLGYSDAEMHAIVELHRREGDDRGRARPEERAPAGLRLRVQGARRHALDRPDGPRPDDVRRPAVPLGRDQQDRQHAERRDRRGHRGRLHAGLEARPEGDRDLPRRLQAHPAAQHGGEQERRRREGARGRGVRRGRRGPGRRAAPRAGAPRRHKLPDERRAITHKFSVAGHEGYITVGLYEDGTPGEIFLTMAKEGSTISGLMDAFATAISLTLQYGVPLEALVEKFSHMRFEPAGYTKNPEIPIAKSLVDYIFRWLASKFLTADLKERAGVISREEPGPATAPADLKSRATLDARRRGRRRPRIAAAFQALASATRRRSGRRGGRAAGHRVRRAGARARRAGSRSRTAPTRRAATSAAASWCAAAPATSA